MDQEMGMEGVKVDGEGTFEESVVIGTDEINPMASMVDDELPEDGVIDTSEAVEYSTPTPVEDEDEGFRKKLATMPEEEKAKLVKFLVGDKLTGSKSGKIETAAQIRQTIDKAAEPKIADQPVFITTPVLKDSASPGFNQSEVQDARKDGGDTEGGVARPATVRFSGPSSSVGDGYQTGSKTEKIDINKFEVSGFTVSFEPVQGAGMVNTNVNVFFDDVESAKVSVNGSVFLYPYKGSFKVARITSGAPTINHKERAIMQYLNGVWKTI